MNHLRCQFNEPIKTNCFIQGENQCKGIIVQGEWVGSPSCDRLVGMWVMGSGLALQASRTITGGSTVWRQGSSWEDMGTWGARVGKDQHWDDVSSWPVRLNPNFIKWEKEALGRGQVRREWGESWPPAFEIHILFWGPLPLAGYMLEPDLRLLDTSHRSLLSEVCAWPSQPLRMESAICRILPKSGFYSKQNCYYSINFLLPHLFPQMLLFLSALCDIGWVCLDWLRDQVIPQLPCGVLLLIQEKDEH